jgi:hypothetical protein
MSATEQHARRDAFVAAVVDSLPRDGAAVRIDARYGCLVAEQSLAVSLRGATRAC